MNKMKADVVVIGGGPGGYPCAFRAADLGLKVVLVDRRPELGGVCLHEGCIPSKAWLNVVKLMQEVKAFGAMGLIDPCNIAMNVTKMRSWVSSQVIGSLSKGLEALSNKRKINRLLGTAYITNKNTVSVTLESGEVQVIEAKNIVIATGSRPVMLKSMPKDTRILDSTSALNLDNPSGRMLIVGAGIIGCELSGVFSAMGLDVTVCDIHHQIMPGTDEELAKVVQSSLIKQGVKFLFNSAYDSVDLHSDHMSVRIKSESSDINLDVDWILVAVGRVPNVEELGLEDLGMALDKKKSGAVIVNDRFQTSMDSIYAIGDVSGGHLAHEATFQGRLCAEIISGKKRHYDIRSMPAVAYTYPELSWVGASEDELKSTGVKYQAKSISWKANGRAIASLHTDGWTKLMADESGRLIGAAVVGVGAGDLISELSLAIEMGANIDDMSLTVRPHPTTSETISLASEVLEGTATDQ